MTKLINDICENHNLHYKSSSRVRGGDINETFSVDTIENRFFIKLNSASTFPKMFAKEAEGLEALKNATLLKVPEVVFYGELASQQYLLLEWMEKAAATPGFWSEFAAGLAQLHRISRTEFGWSSSNYIGSLLQQNEYVKSWSAFYANQRILPLIKQLYDNRAFEKRDVEAAETICKRLKEIFPEEPPALLHGDLWAGNYMVVKGGIQSSVACVYDPALYFGHREMDIGMSLLFGGFDSSFYEAYNDAFPLEKDWRKRVSLTQLYPLLVHAILFGESYVNQCRKILSEW